MQEPSQTPRLILFGSFEFDTHTQELREHGLTLKLQGHPIQVLGLLLQQPGELVTREELRQKLWPEHTFVDFEHGLNAAMQRLREALGDSAGNPRFVETLHRRGYRFIAPVERQGQAVPQYRSRVQAYWIAALAVVALGTTLLGLNVSGLRDLLLGRPAPGEITSLAVLPLENLSGDPEQEYFVDGMTEALIIELGKIGTLRVISRQSSMQYKGTDKLLPEIAKELNVDALVEGSVVREGERVRISAQLIQAAPERHFWADSYERDLRGILAVQKEIARAIARDIRITLTPEEEVRLASTRPVNPEAYEAYLKGRYYWKKRTPEATKKGLEHFQEAIEIDPSYAPPYTGLADSFMLLGDYGAISPTEAIAQSKAAIARALEIDDTLGEAHTSLAMVKWIEWDWLGVERELKRAIELDPSYATAHFWYAVYLANLGRREEAVKEIERARELDPLSLIIGINVGNIMFQRAGQYDEAIARYRKILEMDPNFRAAYLYLGSAYILKGLHEEAIAEFEKALAIGRTKGGLRGLGYSYAVTGRRVEAQEIIDELKQMHGTEWSIAVIYVGLGDKEQALTWLENAHDQRRDLIVLKTYPFLDPLHSDPRFQDLLRRLNFPE